MVSRDTGRDEIKKSIKATREPSKNFWLLSKKLYPDQIDSMGLPLRMGTTTLPTLLTFILFPLLAITRNNNFDGVFNGIWDIHIACVESPVPNHSNGLPWTFAQEVYHDATELCSALNSQAPETVGCLCTSDQAHSLQCHPEIAAPTLYNAVYTTRYSTSPNNSNNNSNDIVINKPFPQYCKEHCICRPAAESETWGSEDEPHTPSSLSDSAFEGAYNPEMDTQSTTHSLNSGPGVVGGGASSSPATEGKSAQVQGSPASWGGNGKDGASAGVAHDQCGGNCSSSRDCGDGCMCSVRSEQYLPGKGTVAFLAGCIISMAATGGGRKNPRGLGGVIGGVGRACPCNATYVSLACCGAADGVVWEREGLKLGELSVQDGD